MRKPSQHRRDDEQPGEACAEAPAWITPELIERTINVWQPFYASPLNRDDAVTMILSVGQLFDTLRRG